MNVYFIHVVPVVEQLLLGKRISSILLLMDPHSFNSISYK